MYKQALVVGRFQPLHKGHVHIIESALERAEKVLILIGSSQESGTYKNPLTYETREEMLKKTFASYLESGRIAIKPLPDAGLGNVSAWGDYVMDKAVKEAGTAPDLFVTGQEDRRKTWFANFDIAETVVSKIGDYSSTKVRNALLSGDFKTFSESVPEEIIDYYLMLKESVEAAEKNRESASI